MQVYAHNLLFALSGALDCVERELLGVTTNHSKRVALMSARLCACVGMSAPDVLDMASCAVLHDNALTEYTMKVGRDAANQHHCIEMHCHSGEAQARGFPFHGDVRDVILNHHENWDGSGYFQLQGEAISLRAAALRLADNADLLLAMGSGETAQVCESVRKHVADARGTLYHPDLVDAFLALCDEAFVADMADAAIDSALSRHVPKVETPLSLEELLSVCELFSGITDAKSSFTADHSRRVSEKAARVAAAYELPYEHALKLRVAAHLHDLGKLTIPPHILEKPSSLTPEEFLVMKGHVLATNELLQRVPGLEELAQWALQHHEKLDGSGYPYGLNADELGFEGRMLACVDIYQALVEDRPYRKGMCHAEAAIILRDMARLGKVDAAIADVVSVALA